ncbi:hypothetical protein N0V93_000127 [Gnomoniopsis smithogilvyi]|uniref:Uncharacterized protein n=1 Tax=Gnomoniopsis smithogilvyi TaxID=1191159 RepID=A0A9W8Z104_9PEZI|nr:hypothetical protein N0V93_000127 [Gnomoniopsis smithogilvyi]
MAADEDLDSGLFNIALSDSEGEDGNAATETARDRTGQTEDEFQAVKRAYRPKVDNGEIWKSIQVPLGQRKVSKQEGQELLHAVEELYFYKRFDEAVAFIGRVFEGAPDAQGLDGEVREMLRAYERKCVVRLGRDNI